MSPTGAECFSAIQDFTGHSKATSTERKTASTEDAFPTAAATRGDRTRPYDMIFFITTQIVSITNSRSPHLPCSSQHL